MSNSDLYLGILPPWPGRALQRRRPKIKAVPARALPRAEEFNATAIGAGFGEPPPTQLRDYLQILRTHWRVAAGCFGAVIGVTLLITLLMPRAYTATLRLQMARQAPIKLRLENNVLALDDGEVDRGGVPTFLATQIAALKSRDLAGRVIRDWRLAENEVFLHPRKTKDPTSASTAPMLELIRQADGETLAPGPIGPIVPASAGTDGGSPGEPARNDTVPVDPALLERYMSYLSVRDVRGTDLIEIGFTTPNPVLSGFLTMAHVRAYMDSNDQARRNTDKIAKEFLAREVNNARTHMEHAEAALSSFARDNPTVAVNQEQKIADHRIAELSTLLNTAEGERVDVESRYEFLKSAGKAPLVYFLDRPGIQKLRLALLDVRAQRAALDERLGPKHPQMADLQRLTNEIEEQIKKEVAQEAAAVRTQYEAAKVREEGLRRRVAQHQRADLDLRESGARYNVLKHDVETARGLYASLLKQEKATAVDAHLNVPTIRVIERADVPQRPSSPKVPLNLAFGLSAGLLLGIGAAFARDYFDSSVKNPDELERLLQLPALAAVPNFALARRLAEHGPESRAVLAIAHAIGGNGNGPVVEAQRNADDELMVLHEPWSQVTEAFRSAAAAILFSSPQTKTRIVVVTSALSGEGKTVTSVNLAAVLAELGSRVLLIDADLRNPRCHSALGMASAPGLSTYLAGETDLPDIVQMSQTPLMSFIPAGPPPPNPAQLLNSERMTRALAYLRKVYDFVLLDTPPVVPVTDAVVLAREADGVVLVVKGQETPRELVRRARDRIVLAGAPLLGVMVNNVGPEWGGDAAGYDLYRYAPPADAESATLRGMRESA